MTLYGIAELAAAIGKSRGLVAQWYKRGKLPEPTAQLAMGPVWTGRTIEGWLVAQRSSSPHPLSV